MTLNSVLGASSSAYSFTTPPETPRAIGASSSGHPETPRASGASSSGHPETQPRTQQNRGAATPPHAPRPNVNRIIAVRLNNELKNLEQLTNTYIINKRNPLTLEKIEISAALKSDQDAQQLNELRQGIRDIVSDFIVLTGTHDRLSNRLAAINVYLFNTDEQLNRQCAHLNQRFNTLEQEANIEALARLTPDFLQRLDTVLNRLRPINN